MSECQSVRSAINVSSEYRELSRSSAPQTEATLTDAALSEATLPEETLPATLPAIVPG